MAYYGSFWADPQTFEAVRVDIRADVIPPLLRVSDATARIDYSRVRIGASDVLLPQSAEQTLRQLSDYESGNRIEFTHCNQYAAESVISFDGQTGPSSVLRRLSFRLVSGRLRRLEKYTDESPYFVVGLEFSEVDFPGNRARFFAELQQVTPAAGLERIAKMPSSHLPGVGTVSVRGGGLRLAAGLRMVWKTTHYSEEDTTSAHH